MRALVLGLVLVFLSGCANIPIKDGGVPIGKDTTATIDDVGVARVTSQF